MNLTREEIKEIAQLCRDNGGPLATKAADSIDALFKEIERLRRMIPKVDKGLHPMHRELILCKQKSIRTENRDKKEMSAFAGIKDKVTPEDVALLRRFYRLDKSRDCDETWSRKNDVVTLMNNYVSQVELAASYFHKRGGLPTDSKRSEELEKEPEGWRKRALGNFQNPDYSSWKQFKKDYPDEARRIKNGEDLSGGESEVKFEELFNN